MARNNTNTAAPNNGKSGTVSSNTGSKNDNIPKYTKQQLLRSNWYSHRRDALSVLLKDDEVYSPAEVDGLLETFMGSEVR